MFSKKFQEILEKNEYEDFSASFDVEKNKSAIESSGESDGGAGGEFFLLTHDKQYVIKTISADEDKVFSSIITDYSKYLCENQECFIGKILGYFVFNFRRTNQDLRVIVIENVFK